MIWRCVSAVAFIAVATPALALSCIPFNAADAYLEASRAPERFLIVAGQLRFDRAQLPTGDHQDPNNTPPLTIIPATLSGKALTATGFTDPYDQRVALHVVCLGPWCGAAGQAQDIVAFVERGADGDRLEVSPCPRRVFPGSLASLKRQILDCHQGRACIGALP